VIGPPTGQAGKKSRTKEDPLEGARGAKEGREMKKRGDTFLFLF